SWETSSWRFIRAAPGSLRQVSSSTWTGAITRARPFTERLIRLTTTDPRRSRSVREGLSVTLQSQPPSRTRRLGKPAYVTRTESFHWRAQNLEPPAAQRSSFV